MARGKHARRGLLFRLLDGLLGCVDALCEGVAHVGMAALRAVGFLLLLPVRMLVRVLRRLFDLLARAVGSKRNASRRCRRLTGEEFEDYVALLLRDVGFRHVQLTRASGDQGVDVLAERGGKRYAIQCKNYAGAVGNAAVQEAFAGAQFYDCDVAAVICPGEFTKAARELAASTGVCLWDGRYLTRLMRRSGRRP